jgi:signal transduction histidine kinase
MPPTNPVELGDRRFDGRAEETKTTARIICKPLPDVEVDPVLLEQLLQNLIANAIQTTAPGNRRWLRFQAGLPQRGGNLP